MRKSPCDLSKTKTCEYGGNKRYNYGFVSGMAGYCRFNKRWIHDLVVCPNDKVNLGEPPNEKENV